MLGEINKIWMVGIQDQKSIDDFVTFLKIKRCINK